MSADLLAEFDSFYQPPQGAPTKSTPASNDLSFLSNINQDGQNREVWGVGVGKPGAAAMTPNQDIWGDMTGFHPSSNSPQTTAPQDDVWGSFEAAAEEVKAPSKAVFTTSTPNHGGTTAATQRQIRSGMQRRPTLEMFSNNMNGWGQPNRTNMAPKEKFPSARPSPTRKMSSQGDVLFDAADELEDDDDFGDFETGDVPGPTLQQPPQLQSLEGLFGATTLESKSSERPKDPTPISYSLNGNNLPYPQAPQSPSFQERNPFENLGLATNQFSDLRKRDNPSSASPITAWPSFEPNIPKQGPYQDSPAPGNKLDDDWGDFADLPPETPAPAKSKPTSGIEADAWEWDAADRASEATLEAIYVSPPTNIPPPSALLPLFPPLFNLPQTSLFNPVANQAFSIKNRILSDPSTIEFLRAYLLIATVAARVIAGRKRRWKRDTLLSQAMKIGPAVAGGKGGMKLAGIDKVEVTREDREATDVVRVWRDQIGRLRSAIAVANSSIQSPSDQLVIPEINENMHVKNQEGALTAPKQCIICGLKREERISKVDGQVEDSFGEWWTEHWGHRACKNFWLEHESLLKHR